MHLPIQLRATLLGSLLLGISGCQSIESRNDEIDPDEVASPHDVQAVQETRENTLFAGKYGSSDH